MIKILLISLSLLVVSCSPQENKAVTIAISPWPGYEFLYLAEQKNFFADVGANIKLLQLGSLSDSQRAYLNGYTDGFASTIIEAVQAQVLGQEPLSIVMVSNYSNGADVIVTSKGIADISELRNLTVGAEVSSLGIFMLQRALEKSNLQLDDVNLVNVEQSRGMKALRDGSVDAFVTYPPVSTNILNSPRYHVIFSSADIPKEIVDVLSLSQKVLRDNPELPQQLFRAWEMARKYYEDYPTESIRIMAAREQISPVDFEAILKNELVILDAREQQQLLKAGSTLDRSLRSVCLALVHAGALETDCEKLPVMLQSEQVSIR